jgi:hypothetical protein
MRKFFCSLIIAHLVLLCLVACKSKAKPVMDLEKDKVYDFAMETDVMQMVGEYKSDAKINGYFSIRKTGEAKDTTILELRYADMVTDMAMSGGRIKVDTRQPFVDSTENDITPDEVFARIFYGMKGQAINIYVDKAGKIVRVTGYEAMNAAIKKSMAMPAEYDQVIDMLLSQQANMENIKDQYQGLIFVLPNRELKTGDTWQSTEEDPNFKYNFTYTIAAIQGDMVTIDFKGPLSSVDSTVAVTGEKSGQLIVNRKTSLVTKSDTRRRFEEDTREGKMVADMHSVITGK